MEEYVIDTVEEENYQQAYQRSLGNLADSKDGKTVIWATLVSAALVIPVFTGVLFGNFLYEPSVKQNIVNPNGTQTVQTR